MSGESSDVADGSGPERMQHEGLSALAGTTRRGERASLGRLRMVGVPEATSRQAHVPHPDRSCCAAAVLLPEERLIDQLRPSAGAATDSEEGVASRIDRRRLEQTVRDREDIEDVTKRYISRECRCLTNCVATSHANCRSLICDVIRQHQG